jgi:hypothetical protein
MKWKVKTATNTLDLQVILDELTEYGFTVQSVVGTAYEYTVIAYKYDAPPQSPYYPGTIQWTTSK